MQNPPQDPLEKFINMEDALSNPQFNLDDPESCDLCGKLFLEERFLIDGEVKDTPLIALPNGELCSR